MYRLCGWFSHPVVLFWMYIYLLILLWMQCELVAIFFSLYLHFHDTLDECFKDLLPGIVLISVHCSVMFTCSHYMRLALNIDRPRQTIHTQNVQRRCVKKKIIVKVDGRCIVVCVRPYKKNYLQWNIIINAKITITYYKYRVKSATTKHLLSVRLFSVLLLLFFYLFCCISDINWP